MGTANTLGYISSFDGLAIVSSAAGRYLAGYVDNSAAVQTALYTLPNGTVVNYDGAGDSVLTPGPVRQRLVVKTDPAGFYAACIARLGHYGTLTLAQLAGGLASCDAILTGVRDATPGLAKRTQLLVIELEWQRVGNWS